MEKRSHHQRDRTAPVFSVRRIAWGSRRFAPTSFTWPGLGWSWSHINQVSCALRFFFGVTLGRPEAFDRIISAKEPKKLPVVLSGEEIVRFLQVVPGLRNRAALTTAYGAGLRVCEVAALKVGDIDSSRMVIRVEHGKGGKGLDRYVMLSPQLLGILGCTGD